MQGRVSFSLSLVFYKIKVHNHSMNTIESKGIGEKLKEALKALKIVSPLIPAEFFETEPLLFDFSKQNKSLQGVNMEHPETLEKYIDGSLKKDSKKWGIGGYGEDRFFYGSSSLFKDSGEDARSIHLGLDIWLPSGTSLSAPISGTVHSFQNNDNFLDYGPTIILEHEADGIRFYTLYGHLSKSSLESVHIGKVISAGGVVGAVGDQKENGSWPPHLHFQIISDMLGKKGDFPGVARVTEKDYYLGLCPNPSLLFMYP